MDTMIFSLRFVALMASILLVLACCIQGCLSHQESEWLLDSVEVEEEVVLKGEAQTVAIDFVCHGASEKFAYQLYFPTVEYVQFHADSVELYLLETLDGFRCQLIDLESGATMDEYAVEYSGTFHGFFFFENRKVPLALSMGGQLQVRRGAKYRFLLQLPAARDSEEDLKMILVAGTRPPVFP